MVGQTLSHFEIIEKLGEGGMGVVYRAHDTRLNRPVAVKVLPGEKVADEDRRRRFAQEARSASALNHPGIVTIYEIAEHEGVALIAMELVHGRTLADAIGRRGLGLKTTIEYGIQIADALAGAHAAGLVHRDLKPANVMVTEQGRVKVLDFGIAKLVDPGPLGSDAAPTATRTAAGTHSGAVIGTLAYMAPEQAEGKRVDARADIFSFGGLLYEMLTGGRAFGGDSPLSTLTAVLSKEPSPIPRADQGAPRELERIITRCLRKDRERRWQSMADVRVALQELKEDIGTAPARQPGRRRTGTWAAAAATLLTLAAAAIGISVWRGRATVSRPSAAPFNSVPLTTSSGREQQPSFSPDGSSVAFSWNGDTEDNWDIYVQLIDPGPRSA